MISITHSFGLIGIDAYPVDIEVDVASGLPSVTIVGLPDSAIKESKERVRAGIKNSGFTFPAEKITINLAPADIKKEGSSYDLAIACGILAASEQINAALLQSYFFVGELTLTGELRAVRGALAMALALRHRSPRKIILPTSNAQEAAVIKDVEVYAIHSLRELMQLLKDPSTFHPFCPKYQQSIPTLPPHEIDFSDVKGQLAAKRALEIAAAGRHNLLMIGPPGSGKTMLAKRLTTILPDLTEEESLETTKIHSASGSNDMKSGLIRHRPFRAPHHTISDIALVGGGSIPQPGEITLAHNGVLFLDELPEYHRNVLETLRQPLEDGCVRIARAIRSLTFPARFMLIAAMNPCPCGGYGSTASRCRCSPPQVHKYRSKISGPLLDRIDLHIEVPVIAYADLTNQRPCENSASIKERVQKAHKIQEQRFIHDSIHYNSAMSHKQIKKHCLLDDASQKLLKMAIEELHLSTRAYDKILKISKTIADLANSENITAEHLSEAIQYRNLDRNYL